MSEPTLLGTVKRYGSGTTTEITFSEDVPAGSSVVGVFAWSGEYLWAMQYSHLPTSTPEEYWIDLLGSASQPEYPVVVIGGMGQLPSAQPPYDTSVYPDPDWEGYQYDPLNPTAVDTPFWIKIEDEVGNFYGWDGDNIEDTLKERNTKKLDRKSHHFHTVGLPGNPVGLYYMVYFSCHKCKAITAGQKLIIKHPGYGEPINQVLYRTDSTTAFEYTFTQQYPGQLGSYSVYTGWSIKEGPYNAAFWKIPGIKAISPTNKGLAESSLNSYMFPDTEYSEITTCNGMPLEGVPITGGYPSPSSGLPSCIEVPQMSEYEYYHLPDYGFAVTDPGFILHAFHWGGGEGDTVTEGEARPSGLTQLLIQGTDTDDTINKNINPPFGTFRDFPLDRGLEVRYRKARIKRGLTSSPLIGGANGKDYEDGFYHWGTAGKPNDFVGWKVPEQWGYWAPFKLTTSRGEVLSWIATLQGMWVHYPNRGIDSLDFDRSKLHEGAVVAYRSSEQTPVLDRLTDTEDDSVEQTTTVSNEEDVSSIGVIKQDDDTILYYYVSGETVKYAISEDEGRTWEMPQDFVEGYSLATFAWGVETPKQLLAMLYDQVTETWLCQKTEIGEEGTITPSGIPVQVTEASEVRGTLRQRSDGVWEFLYLDLVGEAWKFIRSEDDGNTWE